MTSTNNKVRPRRSQFHESFRIAVPANLVVGCRQCQTPRQVSSHSSYGSHAEDRSEPLGQREGGGYAELDPAEPGQPDGVGRAWKWFACNEWIDARDESLYRDVSRQKICSA